MFTVTAIAVAVTTVAIPSPLLAIAACVAGVGALATVTNPKTKLFSAQPAVLTETDSGQAPLDLAQTQRTPAPIAYSFRHYREMDLRRILAALKANSPILVAGEEGSGKTVLYKAVCDQLSDEGFTVAMCEPATPKQMLIEIAEQLGVDTVTLEGKPLTVDQLQRAIATYWESNIAFLVIDDAHTCELKFRIWLKTLKRQGVPMLLLATDPPKSDVFINLPRIELDPLPEYAIRELMETAAMDRGINLKPHELARLQERVGGNPMLAARVIDEEYLGLDIEAGDHRRYQDATPLVLLAGVFFVVIRFIGLGTGNQALYIFGGVLAAIFLGVSRLLYNLPPESRRIKS